MKIKEKQELVRLLHLYMEDIVEANEDNIKEAKKHNDKKWVGTYNLGLKAQYEHARILATRLSVEVGKEIKTYWEL